METLQEVARWMVRESSCEYLSAESKGDLWTFGVSAIKMVALLGVSAQRHGQGLSRLDDFAKISAVPAPDV